MTKFRGYKIFGYTLIGFAALMILLRMTVVWLLPSIEWDKYIKSYIDYPLNIKSTTISFNGCYPIIDLQGIDILTKNHQIALTADHIKLVLNPYTFLFKRIELKDLMIVGMKVRIQYDFQNNRVWLADLPKLEWDLTQGKTAQFNKIAIKHLDVKKSDIHFSFEKNKSLPVREIDLQLTNLNAWASVNKKGEKEIVSEIVVSNDNIALGTGYVKAKGKNQNWEVTGRWKQEEGQLLEWSLNKYDCKNKQCYHFQTWNIELEKIISKVGFFLNEEPLVLAWMKKNEVQGFIDSFAFFATQEGEKIIPTKSFITFKEVGFKAGEEHPGVQGMSGNFSYQDDKIRLALDSHNVVIDYAKIFSEPIVINHVQAQWGALPKEDTRLHGMISTLQIADAVFSGTVSIDQQKGKIQDVDLILEGKKWQIKEALALLPRKVMDEILVEWLKTALQEGNIKQSTLRFKGNPKKFPFDKQEGLFETRFVLENVKLNYAPDWPELNDLKANLTFRNREMLVEAEHAVIANGALFATQATITDLAAPIAILDVKAKLNNQLPQAMEVIENSPLNDSIGKSLSALQFQGGFDLDLGLSIPLTKKVGFPVKVSGKMELEDAKVRVPDWKLEADHVKGVVFFSEKSVLSENLIGEMLNHQTAFTVATRSKEEPDFQITIKGHIGATDLEKWLALSDYHFKTDFIEGDTDYVATLDVFENEKNQPFVLKIRSDLNGVEVKAPLPFKKEAKISKATLFSLEWQPHQFAQLEVEYDEQANAVVLLKVEERDWQFQGGHINLGGLGKAKKREDKILLVDGQMDELDLNEWKKVFLKESVGALSFEPLIALNINKLVFENEVFAKTQVEAQWDKVSKLWNFNFDGPSLKGHVVLPEGEDQREIVVDLKKLTIMGSDENASFQLAEKEVIQRPIDLKIKKLKVKGKSLTDFQARVEPSSKGYDVPRMQMKLKNADILLSGQWDVLTQVKQVTAEGKILTRNTSDLFKALGMSGTVHHAKGNIDFSVQWEGMPTKIDYSTLTGKAAFHLTNGYVQGVDPGIGRVLNLLSLDTMQRRLNLDFSDVTKKGFAFDRFIGAFQFGKGKVSSNKVSLQGPSANIESYGQADLESQEINGVLIVMPNVTGSLPVAAAIAAGNPAVGAAVWLVDKMVSKKLQEIHRYRYRLVGTWDAPKLEDISSFPMSRR